MPFASPRSTGQCRSRRPAGRNVLRDAIARFHAEGERRASADLGADASELPRAIAARDVEAGGGRGARIEILQERFPSREHAHALDEVEFARRELPDRSGNVAMSVGESPGENREALTWIQPRLCSQ